MKLSTGDRFPEVQLNLAGGGCIQLPLDLKSPFTILLFFRGFWWPYCIRLLAGYEERRDAFSEKGATIIAAVADDEQNSLKVAEPLGFAVAYGIKREHAELLGSWWDDQMNFIQPSEFILSKNGEVVASAYSNSPVGRMDPSETLAYITYKNSQN